MESLKTIPELSMTGDIAANFKLWKQRFEIFLSASGLQDKLQRKKIHQGQVVDILLHSIGEEPLRIFNTFEFEDPVDRQSLEVVLKKFEDHFVPMTNETVNRYHFFTRKQGTRESVEAFITDLKRLANDCAFGELKDSLIKDVIVVGVSDAQLRDRLLREPSLKLKSAINLAMAAELAKKQAAEITRDSHVPLVDAVSRASAKRIEDGGRFNRDMGARPCRNCGTKHAYRQCPA